MTEHTAALPPPKKDPYVEGLLARQEQLEAALELAREVTTAYTAEAEDWSDGEFALWRKDDLCVALVRLRAALADLDAPPPQPSSEVGGD